MAIAGALVQAVNCPLCQVAVRNRMAVELAGRCSHFDGSRGRSGFEGESGTD
jgi:hypothetical protein